MMPTDSLCESYTLRLTGGVTCGLTGVGDARNAVRAFSDIFQLKQTNRPASPRIVHVPMEREAFESGGSNFEMAAAFLERPSRDEWQRSMLRSWAMWEHPKCNEVVLEIPYEHGRMSKTMFMLWQSVVPLEQLVAKAGGVPLHGAYVLWEGRGAILSAPSNTGKTTCCRRLPAHWRSLGDDETYLMPDDACGKYAGHVGPTWSRFSGKPLPSLEEQDSNPVEPSWDVQARHDISAVFFLEQSSVDDFTPLPPYLRSMWMSRMVQDMGRRGLFYCDEKQQQAYRATLFDNACKLARSIPCFLLRVSLAGRFWENMQRAMEMEEAAIRSA